MDLKMVSKQLQRILMNLQLLFESVLIAIFVTNSVNVLGGADSAPTLFRVNTIQKHPISSTISLLRQYKYPQKHFHKKLFLSKCEVVAIDFYHCSSYAIVLPQICLCLVMISVTGAGKTNYATPDRISHKIVQARIMVHAFYTHWNLC